MAQTAGTSGAARGRITGVILAGGRGTRMDDADKGLVAIAGRPMVEHVLRALRPQVGTVLISANRNLDCYARLGHPVVADTLPGHQGPLAGVLAVLQCLDTEFAVTVPCDAPLLSPALVVRLYDACCRERADLAVAHDGARRQSVFMLLRSAVTPSLEAYMACGGRRVDAWLERLAVVEVLCSDEADTFVNVNDPDELRRVETRLLSTGGAG